MTRAAGICWPHGATVGHIAVETPFIHGSFNDTGAIIDCDLVDAGKFRNGAARRWCRSHQTYWGVKADLPHPATCKLSPTPMGYLLDPLVITPARYRHVAISALPGANMALELDGTSAGTHAALSIAAQPGLFKAPGIVQLNITPPALAAYLANPAGGCMECPRCGHPHLDLGQFALRPHRRHYCGHCGSDSAHSKAAMVSSPLFRLVEFHAGRVAISGVSSVRSELVI